MTGDAPAGCHGVHHPFRLEGALLPHTQMTSCATVDLTGQGTAHTAEAPATRGWWDAAVVRVVGRSVSTRYSSPAVSFYSVRARIAITYGFCGVVPVPMEGLQASQFGTASEVSPGELSAHRHLLTHISRVVP